jgi:phosphoenolpyruvate-protein phosphotransferase
MKKSSRTVLRGTAISVGLVVGRLARVQHRQILSHISQDTVSADHEWSKFLTAQSRALNQIEMLKSEADAGQSQSELPAVMDGYELLLTDVFIVESVKNFIFYHQCDARSAIEKTFSDARNRIASATDAHLREKTFDIDACEQFLVEALESEIVLNMPDQLRGRIVVVKQPSPQDVIRFHQGGVAGIVAEQGSQLSHAAILARSFNIPTLFSVGEIPNTGLHGQMAILSTAEASLTINPSRSEARKAEARRAVELLLNQKLKSNSTSLARTKDGHRIFVLANADGPADAKSLLSSGAEGIGLLRTEFLHSAAHSNTDIGESHILFRVLAENFAPKWVTVRLLDAGGDKSFPAGHSFKQGPFGVRGIRFLLAEQKILHNQIEAIIRANKNENLRILIPFVTDVQEVRAVKRVTHEIWSALLPEESAGLHYPKIGAMIETPAALLVLEQIAAECDFLSIGSNDLTQHILCVDRTDDELQTRFNSFHPAVLRSLKSVFDLQKTTDLGVCLCGELASDPIATELLIGLGCRQISVQAANIPVIKDMIRQLDFSEAEKFASHILGTSSAEDVRALLNERYEQLFDYSTGIRSLRNRAG